MLPLRLGQLAEIRKTAVREGGLGSPPGKSQSAKGSGRVAQAAAPPEVRWRQSAARAAGAPRRCLAE